MNILFSWAEKADGKIVHVDDVPNGLKCGCHCPHCHEQLLARHGEINEHGFAHHSKTRKATLKICYMVILYKLAEQILLTKKQIHVPSYYGIFKEMDLVFEDVKVDNRYEREDKQPDVIATTSDGKMYLIEFVFKYKVQHKNAIDYKNLTCLEVDLSNQSLESLEKFLISSSEDRKWLNNENYFNRIEETYQKHGKKIRVVELNTCFECGIKHSCCAVGGSYSPLTIENSGKRYRLCKTELYEKELALFKQEQKRKELERIRLNQIFEERKKQRDIRREADTIPSKHHNIGETIHVHETSPSIAVKEPHPTEKEDAVVPEIDDSPKSCLDCKSNLKWMNKNDGWAHCGCYISMGLSQKRVDPRRANDCANYRRGKS